MQLAAHAPPERCVNHLMLLNPRLALERRRDDVRGIVVAVAREIANLNLASGSDILIRRSISGAFIAMDRASVSCRLACHIGRKPALVSATQLMKRYRGAFLDNQ